LTRQAASYLPGGETRYLDILARQVECRIRLLKACRHSPKSPEEAASTIAAATGALVDWWRVHRYVFDGEGNESFQWHFVHSSQYGVLKQWCERNVSDRKLVSGLASSAIVRQATLGKQEAESRVRELLGW
jgi:hypothetical protein